jgi:hypothetical protein
MSTPYHPPVKRSVEIAGHKTSISLEPLFWDWLRSEAHREGLPSTRWSRASMPSVSPRPPRRAWPEPSACGWPSGRLQR